MRIHKKMKLKLNIKKFNTNINNEDLFLFTYDIFLIIAIISVSLLAFFIVGVLQKIICVFELCILMFIEIRLKTWNIQESIFAIICALLFFIYYNNNPVEIAMMYIFIFCARNYSFKRIAIHTYRITLIMLLGICILAEFNIIEDIVFEGYRHAIGFRYVLYGPSLLLNIVFLKIYIEGGKTKWYILIFYFLFDIFLFSKCHAELSFGLTAIFIAFMFYYKISKTIKTKQQIILKIFSYSFIFFLGLSFLLVYLYSKNQNDWYFINHMLSGRLSLSLKALNENVINIFGNKIKWVGNGVDAYGNSYIGEYYYVDNAYINSVLESGLLFAVLIWGMYTICLKKCLQRNEKLLMFILIILSVYFVFDNLKLKLVYNTFWLILPKLILNKPLNNNKYLLFKDSGENNNESIIQNHAYANR